VGQDWFAIVRGSEAFPVRATFKAPAGSAFSVGDLTIAGTPLRWGGQVAKKMLMGLTGVAYGKGSCHNPAVDCEPAVTQASLVARKGKLGILIGRRA
jgi:hypothetical protein